MVVGFQIPDTLQKFLDSIGGIEFGLELLQIRIILQPFAAYKNKKCQNKGRQDCKCHPPVHKKQAQADDYATDGCSENLRDRVGKDAFQIITVAHHGRGQVGKVPLAKERQRQGA